MRFALVSLATVWSGPVRGEEPASFGWTGYYIGGRYWSAWTTPGTDAFNHRLESRVDSCMYERYGVLVEASYKFD